MEKYTLEEARAKLQRLANNKNEEYRKDKLWQYYINHGSAITGWALDEVDDYAHLISLVSPDQLFSPSQVKGMKALIEQRKSECVNGGIELLATYALHRYAWSEYSKNEEWRSTHHSHKYNNPYVHYMYASVIMPFEDGYTIVDDYPIVMVDKGDDYYYPVGVCSLIGQEPVAISDNGSDALVYKDSMADGWDVWKYIRKGHTDWYEVWLMQRKCEELPVNESANEWANYWAGRRGD